MISPSSWETIWTYRTVFIDGWLHTVIIAAISLVLSLLLGLFFALLRRTFLSPLALIYIHIVRSTPFLVQILFFYYIIANAVGLQNRYIAGVLVLSIFSSAYIAEIIRAGIESIGESQLETAKAVGLTRFQTYLYVILPQAFKQMIPPLTGQLGSLIKDSSLLSVVGIAEMTFAAQQINSATFTTLQIFLVLAVGYLVLTLPITFLSRFLEKKFSYET